MGTIQAGEADSRMQLIPAPDGWTEKTDGHCFVKRNNNGEKKNNYLVSLEADISWNTCSSLITLGTHHQRVKIGNSNSQNAQVDALEGALYSRSLSTSSTQNWTAGKLQITLNAATTLNKVCISQLDSKVRKETAGEWKPGILKHGVSVEAEGTILWLTVTMMVVNCSIQLNRRVQFSVNEPFLSQSSTEKKTIPRVSVSISQSWHQTSILFHKKTRATSGNALVLPHCQYLSWDSQAGVDWCSLGLGTPSLIIFPHQTVCLCPHWANITDSDSLGESQISLKVFQGAVGYLALALSPAVSNSGPNNLLMPLPASCI